MQIPEIKEQSLRKRAITVYLEGSKVIRIISKKDYLPSDDELLEIINKCINYLKSKNKSWIEINMDKMKLIGSDIEEDLYFKEVKRAYKEYLEKKMSC